MLKKVGQLIEAGLPAADIAVIAPYAAQIRWLREHAARQEPSLDALEIDTVDGFQGREKEAVVISLVRSNREGEIGFLADTRRMNVALTRARRKLIVIGDSSTLGGHPFYAALLEYFEAAGAYHTVWEEIGLSPSGVRPPPPAYATSSLSRRTTPTDSAGKRYKKYARQDSNL